MERQSEQIARAETRVTKLVFPHNTNPIRTLYGGTAMQWLDEVAFLTATRFSRQQMVTVSMDRIDFKIPIPEGSIVELVGRVEAVGTTSVKVLVELYKEDMPEGDQQLAVSGELVFVAVDENMQPTAVTPGRG